METSSLVVTVAVKQSVLWGKWKHEGDKIRKGKSRKYNEEEEKKKNEEEKIKHERRKQKKNKWRNYLVQA